MKTLLLRFSAPMQAWGAESKYDYRSTETMPTKSAVVGLAASALGRSRESDVSDLNGLRFGVRADAPGRLIEDFHTAANDKSSYVTHRKYLADAAFLVGLEGDEDLLDEIADAISHPVYPLYLGRRSCPPAGKVVLGIRDETLEEVLAKEPLLKKRGRKKPATESGKVRICIETCEAAEISWYSRDLPLSFDPASRRYSMRGVKEYLVSAPIGASDIQQTEHDPFKELEDEYVSVES